MASKDQSKPWRNITAKWVYKFYSQLSDTAKEEFRKYLAEGSAPEPEVEAPKRPGPLIRRIPGPISS